MFSSVVPVPGTVGRPKFPTGIYLRLKLLCIAGGPACDPRCASGRSSRHDLTARIRCGEIKTTEAITLVVRSFEAIVGTLRDVQDGVEEENPTSADQLHKMISNLKQQAWYIGVEIRGPSPRK